MTNFDMVLIEALRSRVRLVEQRLAQVERPNPAINLPALNELRYSLVHLLRYLCNESGALESPEENIRSAVRHAKRAHYDCYESEALFYFKEFAQFEEAFESVNVLEHIPEYIKWSSLYEDVRDLMQSAIKDKRDEYCDQLEEKLLELRPIHKQLKAAKVQLTKHLAKQDEAKIKQESENERLRNQLRISQEALKTQKRQMAIASGALIISVVALIASNFSSKAIEKSQLRAGTINSPATLVKPPLAK